MKKFLILSLFICVLQSGSGQTQTLKFNKDGEFKIVQFTDVHYKNGVDRSAAAIETINRTLDSEKPDLVVLTGDIVIEPAPVLDGWAKVLEPMQRRGIPFAVVFGNHDDEHGTSRTEISQWLAKQACNVSRGGDYELQIRSKEGKKTMSVLYMIDSHGNNPDRKVGGYDYIKEDQIQNFLKQSKKFKRQNQGQTTPSLAFFHIPLPEFCEAYKNTEYPPIGVRMEDECPSKVNSGFFEALRKQGDVMGCFVGHDHDNDYISYYKGMALAYGRYTGGKTTYTNLPNGARVIILTENKRAFSTYIRLGNGDIIHHAQFPRKLTMGITADLHFDMPPETDQYKNVQMLNSVAPLDGVVIVGDIFNDQHSTVVDLFRQRYEKGTGDKTIHCQVYPGMGNHDIFPDEQNPVQNEIERKITLQYMDSVLGAMKADGRIVNLHEGTRCYSWNMNGVHFINTHTFAADSMLGEGGLEWLRDDLKLYAAKGEPVVFFMHYTFRLADMPEAFRWITQRERDELMKTLKGYNIQAIFNGHDHYACQSEYGGYKVYTTDNTWKHSKRHDPSFYMISYDPENKLVVKLCTWNDQTGEIKIEKL